MSIWHTDEIQGYDLGKAETSFTKWRVLIMERLAEIWNVDEMVAVRRINEHGLHALGLDYDQGLTAEQVAQNLAD
jgi:hypothetical protein